MAVVPVAEAKDVTAVTDNPAPTTRTANYQKLDASPADFGAGTGLAAANFGSQVSGSGELLGREAIAIAGLNNETNARNTTTDAMAGLATKYAEFSTKRGAEAAAAYPQFLADLKAANVAGMAGMGNPQAASMYGAAMAPVLRDYTKSAAMHLATETVKGNIDSSVARSGSLADQAVVFRNDPAKVDSYIQGIADEQHHLGEIQGWDADTLKERTTKAQGVAYQKVIESLAIDNPIAAQTMFNRVRDSLDAGDALRTAEFLKPKVEKAQDEGWLAGKVNRNYSLPNTIEMDKLWQGVKVHGEQSTQSQTSPKGAFGVAQIMPDTAIDVGRSLGVKLDTKDEKDAFIDRAHRDQGYNDTLGRAYLEQMMTKYGNPTLATAAYNAGPGRVDEWLKTNGDPRSGAISYQDWTAKIPINETRDYVQRVSNGVGASIGQGTLTRGDRKSLVSDAMASSPDLETGMRRATLATRYLNLMDAHDAQAKGDLSRELENNVEPALHSGQADMAIPEQRIRSTYSDDPDHAEEIIANLKYTRMAGQVFTQVALASPDELQAMREDLRSGNGVLSTGLKGKGALLHPGGTLDPEAPEGRQADLKIRQEMAQELERRVVARNEALKTDPAAYVAAQDPGVGRALAAVGQGNDPNAIQNYATATLAAQARLGLPESRQQLLTAAQVDSIAGKFKNDDPAKADPRPVMQSLAQQYGPYWNKAFGELVTRGKLPDEAAVTAVLDAPGQAQVGQDYVRAWQSEMALKGEKHLADMIAPPDRLAIDQGITDKLADFRASVLVPGVSAAQNEKAYSQMHNGVKLLATYYATQGVPGDQALTKAVDGMIGLKWDFGATYRTPKGLIASSETAMDQAERGLTAANVRDPGAVPGSREAALDPDKRTELWLKGERLWVNNEGGDGVVLRVRGRDGSVAPITTKDGARIEVKFADLAPSARGARGTIAPQHSGVSRMMN